MPFAFDPDRSDVLDTIGLTKVIVVGTTASEARINAARLPKRQVVRIFNTGDKTVYWSFDSSIIGEPLFKNESLTIQVGDIPVWLITLSGTSNVVVHEVS